MSSPENLKRVASGDPIRASQHNIIVDRIKAMARSGGPGTFTTSDGQFATRSLPNDDLDNADIYLRNKSGVDVKRFGILGVGEILIDPGTDLTKFLDRIYMNGELPREVSSSTVSDPNGHDYRFAIAIENVRSGEVGAFICKGIIQVQIEIQETWHEYAAVIRGDVTKLTSAPVGTARILWSPGTVGTQWAIVQLGTPNVPRTYARVTGLGSSAGSFEAKEYTTAGTGLSSAGLQLTGRNFTSGDMGELNIEGAQDLLFANNDLHDLHFPVHWRRLTNSNTWRPHSVNNRPNNALVQVRLSVTSGAAGDADTRASYVYEALDINSARVLQTGINPNSGSWSDYIRPPVGKMNAATRGYGYWALGVTFTLAGCNEHANTEAVEVVTSVDFGAETTSKTTIASPGTA